jgi:hypothetical protein
MFKEGNLLFLIRFSGHNQLTLTVRLLAYFYVVLATFHRINSQLDSVRYFVRYLYCKVVAHMYINVLGFYICDFNRLCVNVGECYV